MFPSPFIGSYVFISNSNNDKFEYFQKKDYIWVGSFDKSFPQIFIRKFVYSDLFSCTPESPHSLEQPKKEEFRTFTKKRIPFSFDLNSCWLWCFGFLTMRTPMMLCPTFRYNFCPLPMLFRRIYFQNICPRRFGLARLLVTDLTSCVDRDLINLFFARDRLSICGKHCCFILWEFSFCKPSRANNNAPMEYFGRCVNVAECFIFILRELDIFADLHLNGQRDYSVVSKRKMKYKNIVFVYQIKEMPEKYFLA